MPYRESTKLLAGPYHPPPLRKGDHSFCFFRDTDVVVRSWTEARISWPRCRALDCPSSGSGLLIDEELARAVATESALAIMHHWGVTHGTVIRWRRSLGVKGMAVPLVAPSRGILRHSPAPNCTGTDSREAKGKVVGNSGNYSDLHQAASGSIREAPPGFEPGMADLQSTALPLG